MSCPLTAILCLAPWQPHTAALEAISQALIAVDAAQTARLAPEGFTERESDCVIGHYPKPTSVALYFGGLAIGHFLAENALEKVSPRWADVFEGVTVGWESATIAMNFRIGVRL